MMEHIREAYRSHQRDWTLPGFRAVAVYRFGRWAEVCRYRWLSVVLGAVYTQMYRYVRNHYTIELPRSARVGRRLVIGHQGGIVIHWGAQIGDDCLIRQNATLGAATGENYTHAPVLGNRVEVGCGAAIIGRVRIGDDVRIGPNAVVTTNVPAGSTVVVPSPRVIQFKRPSPSPNGSHE